MLYIFFHCIATHVSSWSNSTLSINLCSDQLEEASRINIRPFDATLPRLDPMGLHDLILGYASLKPHLKDNLTSFTPLIVAKSFSSTTLGLDKTWKMLSSNIEERLDLPMDNKADKAKNPYWMTISPPGGGKTTFCNFTCMQVMDDPRFHHLMPIAVTLNNETTLGPDETGIGAVGIRILAA